MKQLKGYKHFVNFIGSDYYILNNNTYYAILMDYCNGGDFENYLNKLPGHRLSEPEAYYWFEQLLRIHGTLIKKQMIHRDIKPRNLFLHYTKNSSMPILVKYNLFLI